MIDRTRTVRRVIASPFAALVLREVPRLGAIELNQPFITLANDEDVMIWR